MIKRRNEILSSENIVIKQNNINNQEVKIIASQNTANKDEGQIKCPKCGATDIQTNTNKGLLRCMFCRHEFKPLTIQSDSKDIFDLQGLEISERTNDIVKTVEPQIVTLKCESCGSEVSVDLDKTSSARCHWCRNKLSINHTVSNGQIPDMILPFKMKKENAIDKINEFVKKRKFFAHPTFTREFNSENTFGVFLPYYVIDANVQADFRGDAEIKTKEYKIDKTTYYEADSYVIGRKFDLAIDDLTLESSRDKLYIDTSKNTNNIINSILPFDTENAVEYNSNFITGFNSEKRDTNVKEVKQIADTQIKDIARSSTKESTKQYDRGVSWKVENVNIIGEKWKSIYCPIWLYSYYEAKKDLKHYVAVNARTGETIGSIPINYFKLLLISLIIQIFGTMIWWFLIQQGFLSSRSGSSNDNKGFIHLLLTSGIMYFSFMFFKYRNTNARHFHEKETRFKIRNLQKVDNFTKHLVKLENEYIPGCNSDYVEGSILNNDKLSSTLNKIGGKQLQSILNNVDVDFKKQNKQNKA